MNILVNVEELISFLEPSNQPILHMNVLELSCLIWFATKATMNTNKSNTSNVLFFILFEDKPYKHFERKINKCSLI